MGGGTGRGIGYGARWFEYIPPGLIPPLPPMSGIPGKGTCSEGGRSGPPLSCINGGINTVVSGPFFRASCSGVNANLLGAGGMGSDIIG